MDLITGDALMRRVFPPRRFLVDGLIGTGLTVLAGAPKAGKSFLSLQLSQSITGNTPFLGHEVEEGSALYLAYEDGLPRIQDRIRRQDFGTAGLERLAISTNPYGLTALEAEIRAWYARSISPRLVVIDTYGRGAPSPTGRASEYQHATELLGPLQKLALELNITILVVHHTNKEQAGRSGADPFERIHGSQAILGVADAALILSRDRHETTGVLQSTARDYPETLQNIQWDEARCIWLPSEQGSARFPGETGKRRRVLLDLEDARGLVTVAELRESVEDGRQTNALNNTLRDLVNDGLIVRVGRGDYALPQFAPAEEGDSSDTPSEDMPSPTEGEVSVEGEEAACPDVPADDTAASELLW